MRQPIDLQAVAVSAHKGLRLDQAAGQLFPDYSRSRLKQWIIAGHLKVDGKIIPPDAKLCGGEIINIVAQIEPQQRWEGEAIKLDVVHEDDHIMVINKPPGLVVHPAVGHQSGTLLNALLHYSQAFATVPRAGIVHRLDKDTSGLMVIAKTLIAQNNLVSPLQERSVGREYEAVVNGVMTGGGSVDKPIGRDKRNHQKMAIISSGKMAVTHYRIIERFRGHTYLRLRLETGRTHQIRVHMAHINFALVGDPLYSNRSRLPKGISNHLRLQLGTIKRQMLHAKGLTLKHPSTGEKLRWEIGLPDDFTQLLTCLTTDKLDSQACQ